MKNKYPVPRTGTLSSRLCAFSRVWPRRLTGMLATSLMLLHAPLHAQGFEEDFDDAHKPWQEIAVQLPASPVAENLIPFYVSPTATQTFAVDPNSLTVGTDGVIRYTLVTTSGGGARNISYEGIRCTTFERKLYAFGHSDGSWSRSRRDRWERIPTGNANRHHASLAQDYFCDNVAVAGDAEDMLRRLRMRQPLTRHLYQ